ncbi:MULTISPECIES: hypothetical protein [Methylotenera]|uniref:hypothetical protein n=1 Tax=Methylotenera TaxID=359407 RepID=UPI00037CB98F|nr:MULTISPECIES: hypothetical protein [Methylotenera]
MKLLNRLRELRNDYYAVESIETDIENEYLDTIGVGTTTVDDIIRLNLEHINLQQQAPLARYVY